MTVLLEGFLFVVLCLLVFSPFKPSNILGFQIFNSIGYSLNLGVNDNNNNVCVKNIVIMQKLGTVDGS